MSNFQVYIDPLVREQVELEDILYGKDRSFGDINCNDPYVLGMEIVHCVPLRPLRLGQIVEFIVNLSGEYSFLQQLKCILLNNGCYSLVRKLYDQNYFDKRDILGLLARKRSYLASLFFYDIISDLNLFTKNFNDEFNLRNRQFQPTELSEMIQFGFQIGSFGYSLKFDLDQELLEILNDGKIAEEIQWSPFEWSRKPKYLSLISVACHFGSFKCFQILLSSGALLSENLVYSAYSGGNSCIIDTFIKHGFNSIQQQNSVLEYYHLDLVTNNILAHNEPGYCFMKLILYYLEYGEDINKIHESVFALSYFGTYLHHAASNGYVQFIKYLVSHEADIRIVNIHI